MCGVPCCDTRGLVVPSATVRRLRPRGMLRLLAGSACPRPLPADGTPLHAELRAGRDLVLGLRNRQLLRGAATRTAAPPPREPTCPRTRRRRSGRLDSPPPRLMPARRRIIL